MHHVSTNSHEILPTMNTVKRTHTEAQIRN